MAPMESQGWRKKSTVTVLYSYSYPVSNSTNNSNSHDGGNEVSMREGERLILLEKSNTDWWQVRRPGDKSQPFYAPANYLQEDGISKAKKLFLLLLHPTLDRLWLRNPVTSPSIRLVTTNPMPIDVTLVFRRPLPLQSPI